MLGAFSPISRVPSYLGKLRQAQVENRTTADHRTGESSTQVFKMTPKASNPTRALALLQSRLQPYSKSRELQIQTGSLTRRLDSARDEGGGFGVASGFGDLTK